MAKGSRHSSVAVKKLLEGSYFDRIVAFLRHGHKKAPLSKEDERIFSRIEWVKDQWEFYKSDRMAVKQAVNKFKCSQAQAYNYLADAKAIYTLFQSINIQAEVLLLKEWIDKGLKLAVDDPKNFSKQFSGLIKENREWILMVQEMQERQRPDEPKKYVIVIHNDWSKIPGYTPELREEWNKAFDLLEQKAKNKTPYEAEDIEYVEA